LSPEPTTDFQFPVTPQIESLKDFFRAQYGRSLTRSELEWLAQLVTRYLDWSQENCGKNQLRIAAQRMVRLLSAIDEWMAASKDPERTWGEISLALGLPSVCFNHLTGSELASSRGLTKMAVSKRVTRFLHFVQMEPAFGANGRRLTFRSFGG
jgi:hypothetical protein